MLAAFVPGKYSQPKELLKFKLMNFIQILGG